MVSMHPPLALKFPNQPLPPSMVGKAFHSTSVDSYSVACAPTRNKISQGSDLRQAPLLALLIDQVFIFFVWGLRRLPLLYV